MCTWSRSPRTTGACTPATGSRCRSRSAASVRLRARMASLCRLILAATTIAALHLTVEAVGFIENERHPFSGARYSRDALERYSHIDIAVVRHWPITKSGTPLFSGTCIFEIALAVARSWLRTNGARIADCEILRALDLTNGETREIMSRVSANSSMLNFQSSPPLGNRLADALPLQDLRGDTPWLRPAAGTGARRRFDAKHLSRGEASGRHYGPAFRLVDSAVLPRRHFHKSRPNEQERDRNFVLDPSASMPALTES